jgi:phosphate transport system substrate-binding protein
MKNLKLMMVALLLVGQSLAHAQNQTKPALINGAGASFPYPLYSKWFSEYKKENPQVEINYQSIGSGGGIKQLIAKTVDFGASDAPMTDAELSSAPAPILHFPTVMGAVVLTYNLPEVKTAIHLTPDVLADIMLGKISKWNDPRLQALNKGIKFPATDIAVAYRSDSSGTTAIFTNYLAKVSPAWKTAAGEGKTVKWPVGIGGKGNEGVAGFVKNTPGAFGYVELVYAQSEKLPMADLRNKAGKFVKASVDSVSAAAAGSLSTMPADFRVSITDADGARSYPISSFTYLLVYQSMEKAKGSELVKFLNWAMGKGQSMAPTLFYAPLPSAVREKVTAKIKTIELK